MTYWEVDVSRIDGVGMTFWLKDVVPAPSTYIVKNRYKKQIIFFAKSTKVIEKHVDKDSETTNLGC